MTDTSTTTIPDLRPELGRALDQMGELIAGLTPEQATLATPCSEYDVTGLVAHVQGAMRRVTTVLSGKHFAQTPSTALSEDWTRDWEIEREALKPVLADDALLTRQVTVPWGQLLGGHVLGIYLGEFVVHAWDLAAATGQTDRLDQSLAEGALSAYQQGLPPEPRGGEVPFGPVVEIGADAGPYERLVAWTGRDPRLGPAFAH